MERTSNRSRGVGVPRSFPVVFLLFLTVCFQVGTIQAIGIYLKDISESIGTSSTDIGVAIGLFIAFGKFPAPLIVALYRVKSIRRWILILGSCLISLGVILTALATNNALIAVYLSISGIGHCMVGICSTVALSHVASEQNFNILYGVGLSGFGLGMVLLPFLAEVFSESYGWRGGLLLLGVLMANLVPCAMAIETSSREAQATSHRTNNQPSGPSEDRFFSRCSGSPASEDGNEEAPLYPEETRCR
nr:monocarboxylate transporter 11-like [Lytechinus pictus]